MNILGVDPGLDGALALVCGGTVSLVHDMPTVKVTVNKKIRRVVDIYALARWFDVPKIDMAVIEDVHSLPKDGGKEMFKFGRSVGNVEQAAACNLIPIRYVPPAVWKRALGLEGQNKDASRRLASQIFPASSHLWPLEKHDGRAESVLLAYYGRKFVGL